MRNNPYVKTDWVDNIFDPIENEVIQEGTRFTAERANNIEEGIYNAYERMLYIAGDVLRLKVQMELDGRVPGSMGTFYDTFSDDDPLRMVRQESEAVLTEERSAGDTVLNVDNTVGFKKFTEVSIYDGESSEDALITDVTDSTIIVHELEYSYKKGANVSRSSAMIIDNKLVSGEWFTYSISPGVEK